MKNLAELRKMSQGQLNIRTWIEVEENFEKKICFVSATEKELNDITSQLFWGQTSGNSMILSDRTSLLFWEKR